MKNQHEPQARNPNFRRQQGPPIPQVMQREPRNRNENQIRPPFQQNLVDEEYLEEPQELIHQFGDDPEEIVSFVTKYQHYNFVSQEDEGDQEPIGEDSESSHTTYLNALSVYNEACKQYELRSINVVVAPPKKVTDGQASSSQHAKIDSLVEAVKALVKISIADKNQMKNQHEPQVRNPNFRRQQGPPVPQVMQREAKNPNEQQMKPPFPAEFGR